MKTILALLILFPMSAMSSEIEDGRVISKLKITCTMKKSKLTFNTDQLVLNVNTKLKTIQTSELLRNTELRLTSMTDVSGNLIKKLTTETIAYRIPSGRVMGDSKMVTAVIVGVGSEEDVGKHIVNIALHNMSDFSDGTFSEKLDAEVSVTSLADDDTIWGTTQSKKCSVKIIQ